MYSRMQVQLDMASHKSVGYVGRHVLPRHFWRIMNTENADIYKQLGGASAYAVPDEISKNWVRNTPPTRRR